MSFPWSDLPYDDPAWYQRGALYVPSGEGPTVWAADDVYTIKARASQTNGAFGFIEATVPGPATSSTSRAASATASTTWRTTRPR